MTTVRSVVDRVGPTLLHEVTLPEDGRSVADVVIAEGGPHGHLAAGDLVLAVTTSSVEAAVDLVRECAERGAAAVLLKPPLAQRAGVRKAATAAGIGLIEVNAKASWAQLVWLLRTVLDAMVEESDDSGADEPDAEAADLFRLADAAASVVDAPVTIEDTNSRVLAYSARQDITDPARVSTIMGRRIPDDVLARFRSRGVFRELSEGRQTIFVPAQQDGTLPRLIVPIRMGGELLGSMWAVVDGPVSDERAAAFADAAPVVAVHLLRRRAHADAHRRATAELLRAVLDGKASPRRAIAELGLTDAPHRVVAVDTEPGKARHSAGASSEGLRLAMLEHISKRVGRHTNGCVLGGVLYVVVPEDRGGWEQLRATLTKEATGKRPLHAAAGTPRPLGELAGSRAEADEALGLLRADLVDGPVVGFDEVWTSLALHRVATAAVSSGAVDLGPLSVLREHDRSKNTEYVDTLYSWLLHAGDPRAAAEELRIHPNTLRYRVRKLLELSGLNLSEADVRLALLAQLIVLRWS